MIVLLLAMMLLPTVVPRKNTDEAPPELRMVPLLLNEKPLFVNRVRLLSAR